MRRRTVAAQGGRTHVETRTTLIHEYTHALLRRNRRAPLAPWYDHGLALLWPLAGDPHGGRTSAQARARLERAGLLPSEPARSP